MRRIFHGSKQNTATASTVEKDLKGVVFNVSGLHVAIENKIAEGGFSFVYVVRCNKTNRFYALKRQFVNESRLLEACKREIEITRTLGAHPNIVGYVSSSLKAGPDGVYEYLLVTNYYKHSVLQMMNDRLAAEKHLTVKEILKIFGDVCCAVARLHHCQTPVIHRDLKVENLLLEPTTSGKSDSSSRSSTRHHHHHHQASTFPFICVLCDFGSCTTRHLTPGEQATSNSSTMSALQDEIARFTTLSYRAPELVDLYSGFPITTKVDIWALGVMLYKLCFFTLPFGESTLAIQSATFSFPSEPPYPAELLGLIIYLLNPDPHKRPDIFQVASVVFRLLGEECPVKNLNNAEAISIQFVVQLYASFQNKNRGISTTTSDSTDFCNNRTALTPSKLSNSSSQKSDLNVVISAMKSTTQVPEIVNPPTASSTSVVPRQRPRVQQTAISPATAFTLINNKAENAVGPWKPKQKTPSTVDTISTSSQSTKENKTPSNFANPNYAVKSENDENEQLKIKSKDIKSDQVESYQENCRLSAGDMQGHRRNISDPSTVAIETERCSAFRPYHSQHQVSAPSAHPPLRPGAKTPPHTLDTQSADDSSGGGCRHPLTLSPSWNPFDLDDQSFGVHFDELPRRRGSASSNQKTLLDTLNSTLNPEKFASPSKKVSKYEKLINYLDDIGHHHEQSLKKDASSSSKHDKLRHHNQQKISPEDGNTNLTVPPSNQKCRMDDASSSGVKYRAMGNRRKVRGSGKDSEADSVGSASDLQARMQVSSTTDEDASDGGIDARRSRRRRCEKRQPAKTAAVIDDEDQGSENAASSPTTDDEDAATAAADEKDDDVRNANDNSSYDLDLNLEYSPGSKDLDDGEIQADVSAAGRRPLLQGGDFDDENDFSPGASFSNAPAQFLQDNFRQKHRRSSATSNDDENLEMNVFSPTSLDTIVTMRRNLGAMKIAGDSVAATTRTGFQAAAAMESSDFDNRRTAPSPIFPVRSEQLGSSRTSSDLASKKNVGNSTASVVVSADVFADAPFSTSPPRGDFVDDKSSDDEAALVTVSPKKQAAAVGVKSSTQAKNSQPKIEDLQSNSNQYQKLKSATSSTSGAGSNLSAKVMIIDQNHPINKKSAFVNTSFQGDDNFPNK